MLHNLRNLIARNLEHIIEFSGLIISLSGAALASLFGRFMLAVILGGVAIGIFLRIKRRRQRTTPTHAPNPAQPAMSAWIKPVAFLLVMVEVAVLVEFVPWPADFLQDGFSPSHWLIAGLAILALFYLQIRMLNGLASRVVGRGV